MSASMQKRKRKPPLVIGTHVAMRVLREHFETAGGRPDSYIFLEQVPDSIGGAGRRADALVMSAWRSRGLDLLGIEMKVSRSDWLREKKDPSKADAIARYCDKWYVCAPEGVVWHEEGELPDTWGLFEIVQGGDKGLKVVERVKPARGWTAQPLNREFIAGVLRCISKTVYTQDELDLAREDGRQAGIRTGRLQQESEVQRLKGEVERLGNKIAVFQAASGVNLSTPWTRPEQIGEAVKMVLDNRHLNISHQIARHRERIDDTIRGLKNLSDHLGSFNQASQPSQEDSAERVQSLDSL